MNHSVSNFVIIHKNGQKILPHLLFGPLDDLLFFLLEQRDEIEAIIQGNNCLDGSELKAKFDSIACQNTILCDCNAP